MYQLGWDPTTPFVSRLSHNHEHKDSVELPSWIRGYCGWCLPLHVRSIRYCLLWHTWCAWLALTFISARESRNCMLLIFGDFDRRAASKSVALSPARAVCWLPSAASVARLSNTAPLLSSGCSVPTASAPDSSTVAAGIDVGASCDCPSMLLVTADVSYTLFSSVAVLTSDLAALGLSMLACTSASSWDPNTKSVLPSLSSAGYIRHKNLPLQPMVRLCQAASSSDFVRAAPS